MTLTEMLDREEIRRTMAQYTMAGDRLQLDEFLAVFTPDAVLESEGVAAEDRFRYEGLDQIRGWMQRWSEQSRDDTTRPHGATFVRHHLSTSQIELTGGESARARTYWTAYTDIGADHCGYYLDRFHKSGDQWLIAHRRVRIDWQSARSLFTGAVNHTS